MRIRTVIAGLAFALVSNAGFAQDVKVDFDKSANFAALKTFASKIGTSWGNPLSEKRVTAEIEGTLKEKGWTKTDVDKADALVVIHGATQQKHNVSTFYSGGWGGYGYRGFGGGMGSATTMTSEYTVGTLVVDIFDAKSKQLVFRGNATDELSDKVEKNVKKVAKASDKMFKDFPPGSAKK